MVTATGATTSRHERTRFRRGRSARCRARPDKSSTARRRGWNTCPIGSARSSTRRPCRRRSRRGRTGRPRAGVPAGTEEGRRGRWWWWRRRVARIRIDRAGVRATQGLRRTPPRSVRTAPARPGSCRSRRSSGCRWRLTRRTGSAPGAPSAASSVIIVPGVAVATLRPHGVHVVRVRRGRVAAAAVVRKLLEGKGAQDLRRAPDVIGVIVARDVIVDLRDAERLQVANGFPHWFRTPLSNSTTWPSGEIRTAPSPWPTSM